MLTDDQLLRYSRQILLPEFDVAGQAAAAAARVLVIGAGGLGCPAALYLAGAGVGELILVDPDMVDSSNLHRQIAYREADVGQPKARALAATLRALNSDVRVHEHVLAADGNWLASQVPGVTLVLDCSDNFATRESVNRACHAAGVPLISGAAIRQEGQLAVFDFRQPDSPCYGCLYGDGEGPDTLCSESGILGPVVGTVGTLQAHLALRLLSGADVGGVLHLFDGATMSWRQLRLRRDPGCRVCGG
ncbi:molybdopterin-synthase adenylyltransferase MoeB [Alcanivorax sp. JB21]|uniref:HesA/MoeB/ThiF family protein n=1 Tax=Alcanivorax limicola TaxID=2874102 RepID=UPI001CC00AAF|nr:molybdopterin-synthase adenylyltransferase MoeB [Alcanivorax limicola]MBZ2188586.1 molybdopterin-synthase adenylyltransferase MoeB [Alcanivorax limicola]